MSNEGTSVKSLPVSIPNNYTRYKGEYRRVSIDPTKLNPETRRFSVSPLLEAVNIKEITAVHSNKNLKDKGERSEKIITAEEEGLETAKDKPPLQPLDPIEGVTIGLELLVDITHILIRQHTETEEALFGVRSVARYDIMDESFNKMYYAWETESSGCGSSRAFTLRVADFSGRPVLVINRVYSWCNCLMETINCCGSYGSKVYVTLPDGNRLGKVKQTYQGCTPTFSIMDEFGDDILYIEGPTGADWGYGINICFTEVAFRVYSDMTGEEIGIITKKWPNLFGNSKQKNTEYFGVQMPKDLAPNLKSLLLGTVFTIDSMYFEHTKSSQKLKI